MIFTYLFSLILYILALYLAEHLYLKDNSKVYNMHIFNIIPFIILLCVPFVNVLSGIVTILFILTKSQPHIEYFYNGIFKIGINKLITKYNNFLWIEI